MAKPLGTFVHSTDSIDGGYHKAVGIFLVSALYPDLCADEGKKKELQKKNTISFTVHISNWLYSALTVKKLKQITLLS